MMSEQYNLFFELVRVALGNQKCLSKTPTEEEWTWLFDTAEKQAVDGITYGALEVLAQRGQKPTEDVMLDWFSFAEEIKNQNKVVNQRCKDITKLFAEAGFKSCILKGQGNAMMYPNPLSRVSGDIDIWVEGKKDNIIGFCRSIVEGCELSYHHIQFPIFEDVPVEVHFMPSYSLVPRYSKKTKNFFENFKTKYVDGRNYIESGLDVPEIKMNLVFQMSHMMRHFFYGGIGLRQLMDYYYLLLYAHKNVKCDMDEVRAAIKDLGMLKFAKAVMWILKEICGMENKYLIVTPDNNRGQLLLDEMMKSGNFGQYDQRWTSKLLTKSTTLSIIMRNVRMLRLFPEEAICAPITGLWRHFVYHERD